MRKIYFILGLMFIFVFTSSVLFAQKVEQLQKTQQDIEKERQLRGRIEKEKAKPEVQEERPPEVAPLAGEAKTLIKDVRVTGATLIPEKDIRLVTAPLENKEITIRELQKAADMITDIYRQKGYITSRAYLPPQKIEQGVLEIRMVEGITGDIQVKGNRYFKTPLLKSKIALKKGDPFNYEILRKGLSKINEHQDCNAKAVLTPGKERGATDVVLEVKDNLPIHAGFTWDNFGSRYIDRDRFRTTLTHNNLLGWDDVLTFEYQLSQREDYRLLSLRYALPINENLKVGFFAANSKLAMGREYEDLMARGKSKLYSIYATQQLINRENASLNLNIGFDYKDNFNFQLNEETSRDRLRVAKLGLDLDLTDGLGRTIVTNEVAYGIPHIMGGLDDSDSRSSRGTSGSGGKFVKDTVNLYRLQKLPFNSNLLWKNQLQFSPYTLTSTEQFQIGGIANVRGYPPAEVVGDEGYSMTWEWSMPPYFVPRNTRVPFSKAKVYDAVRVVTFYDWANARLRRPDAGVEKEKTLRAAGCGLRVNLPENIYMRIEVAWPLDNTPSDSDHVRTWAEFSKNF